MAEETTLSNGVQELIDKLRGDGVNAGQKQADDILQQARDEAAKVLADAEKKAKQLVADAEATIASEKTAAEEALKLAARDTVLRLGTEIRSRLNAQVKNLIGKEIGDKKFLKKVILAIAGQCAEKIEKDAAVDLIISEQPVEDAKGTDTKELEAFVKELSAELLRKGIEIHTGKGDPGVHIQLADGNLDIQLTSETLANMLSSRLQGRFQHIMVGIE